MSQREPPWREWNEVCVCVCVWRGLRGPFYSSRGRFRPSARMEGGALATTPRNAPRRVAGQVQPTQGVGRPHLAASHPHPFLSLVEIDASMTKSFRHRRIQIRRAKNPAMNS